MSAWDVEGQQRLHEIINDRITELEKNCEGSFAKVENHVMRILKVIDVQAQSTEMLTDKIAELEKNNAKVTESFSDQLTELRQTNHELQLKHEGNMNRIAELKEVLREHIISHQWYDDRGIPVVNEYKRINEVLDKQLEKLEGGD